MIRLDQSSLVLITVMLMSLVGFWRGVRAEGLTLAGILAATVIFTTESMRLKLVTIINRLPRVVELLVAPEDNPSAWGLGTLHLIGKPDDRLVFYALSYLITVGVFYWAGSVFGGLPLTRAHRLLGAIMGGINGFLLSFAMVSFGQDYLSRHPSPEPVTITLPGLGMPQGLSSSALGQYVPLVFLLTFFLIIILTLTSMGRAKNQ
jgi:hypothetical protein